MRRPPAEGWLPCALSVRKPEPLGTWPTAGAQVTLGVRLVTVGGVRGRDAGAGRASSGGGCPDGTGPERADAGGAGAPDGVLRGAGFAVRAGRDAALVPRNLRRGV